MADWARRPWRRMRGRSRRFRKGLTPERIRNGVVLALAASVAIGMLMLIWAALVDVIVNPNRSEITPAYVALIQTTLGVLVGGLVGWLGGSRPATNKEEETDE